MRISRTHHFGTTGTLGLEKLGVLMEEKRAGGGRDDVLEVLKVQGDRQKQMEELLEKIQ